MREGSFLNFCKAVNEVTGELKRTTWNFTFLLASALVRKSDVEELAKKGGGGGASSGSSYWAPSFPWKNERHTELHVNRHIGLIWMWLYFFPGL